MTEKTIVLYETDHEITCDFTVTASHVRYGRFYVKETCVDDWEITLHTIDGWPASHFTPAAQAEIIAALEEQTDIVQEEYEAHVNDALYEDVDRRADEIRDRVAI